MKQKTIERHERYRDYKREGHTLKEVAEHFGISVATAQNACKGIAIQKPKVTEKALASRRDQSCKRNQWVSRDITLEEYAEKLIEEKTPWFEYAGGYTNSNGYVYLRCKKCGHVQYRGMVSVRHGTATCDICKRIETEERRRAVEEAEKAKKREKELKRLEKEEAQKAYIESRKHPCVICGKETTNRFCCSPECCQKRNNQIKEVRRRAKIKTATIDKHITLQAVYDKDNGTCYLCGGQCDWNDKEERHECIVCGNTYPSIDHVVPLAKGGAHSWENVRLAHRWCNSMKSSNGIPLS